MNAPQSRRFTRFGDTTQSQPAPAGRNLCRCAHTTDVKPRQERLARHDRRALEILQAEMPGHRVIGVDSTELIWGLGSFHCISQQEPAP